MVRRREREKDGEEKVLKGVEGYGMKRGWLKAQLRGEGVTYRFLKVGVRTEAYSEGDAGRGGLASTPLGLWVLLANQRTTSVRTDPHMHPVLPSSNVAVRWHEGLGKATQTSSSLISLYQLINVQSRPPGPFYI